MLTISVNESHEWSIMYRLDGVKCVEVVTRDLQVAVNEITHKLRLMRGLAQGKTFVLYEGKEI